MKTRELIALLNQSIATGNIASSLANVFQQGICYINLHRSHLAKLDAEVKFNGKIVRKMQIITTEARNNHRPSATVLMHFDDAITPFVIKPQAASALCAAFISLGAKEETIFANHRLPTVNWLARSQRQIYNWECELNGNDNVYTHYEALHDRLRAQLRDIMHAQPDKKFNIVDGGCGDGKFLKNLEEELKSPAKLAGFDVNHINILHAEINNNKNGERSFAVGTLLRTGNIIAQLQAKNKLHDGASAETIMVLSGSLTRRVIKNMYDALDIFSAIARQPSIQYVIGGGINEPMMNRYFAKQMGFMQKPRPNDAHQYDFCYERMDRSAFAALKLAKMRKKKIVDLAFCPDDAMLVSLLPEIQQDMTIDLSFCHYTGYLEKALEQVLRRFPKIKIIFHHHNSNVFDAFCRQFKNHANIISLKKISTDSELPLFNTYRKLPQYGFFPERKQALKTPVANVKMTSRL